MKIKKIVIKVKEPETVEELEEWADTFISNAIERTGFKLAIYKMRKWGLLKKEKEKNKGGKMEEKLKRVFEKIEAQKKELDKQLEDARKWLQNVNEKVERQRSLCGCKEVDFGELEAARSEKDKIVIKLETIKEIEKLFEEEGIKTSNNE